MNYEMKRLIERFNDIIFETSKIKIPSKDKPDQEFERQQLEHKVVGEIILNLADAEATLDKARSEFVAHNGAGALKRNKSKSYNIIQEKIIELLEATTTKIKSTVVHAQAARILHRIMGWKWYTTTGKETWTLINTVNYFFDLHDFLEDSYLSKRLLTYANELVMQCCDEMQMGKRKSDISASNELSKLLGSEQFKTAEKAVLDFGISCKDLTKEMLAPPLIGTEPTEWPKQLMKGL